MRSGKSAARSAIGVIAVAAVVCGCATIPHPVGPVPTGVSVDQYGALQSIAAREIGCPREKLTYETFGDRRHLFRGCGDAVEMLLFENSPQSVTGGYLMPGGSIVVSPAPSSRYAKEIGCDVKSTKEQRVDFRTRVVDGCGKRITYVQVCNGACSWIANH